ncbi:MAG: cysteine desulfurase [Firmicutes bacterium]|nr:cysteine desulfurase [Bacillota bacterium]
MQIYLDNSATTRQYDQVTEVMTEVMRGTWGNPSSLHMMGVEAEKMVRASRKICGSAISASTSEEFYFTSGGTESDNTALMGVAQAKSRMGKKIITTAVEHPAVLEPAKRLEEMGFQVEYIGVDRQCRLNMDQLEAALSPDTILISVMGVNNETGTVMPMKEIGQLKEKYNRDHGTGILLHCDGVQAFGKVEVNVKGNYQDVDFLSVSGHKIHGPKGIGGLYVKKSIHLPPFMLGGGQEKHMRSGTENTPAIIGFGKAVELMTKDFAGRTAAMEKARKTLLEGIQSEIRDIRVNSPEDGGAPSVLNVSFLGTRGEVLLHTLEQAGIYVSTGSACSSNKKGQSHVLKAMGLKDKEIEGAIRFSFSEFNTVEEMEYVVDQVKAAVARFRRLGSFR